MNRSVFSVVLGVLASASLHAATLTVSIDGTPQVLQLQGLSIDSEGNVKVTATSGTGGTGTGGTDTGGTDTGGTGTGGAGTGGTATSCVSGTNLVCVDTKLPGTALSRVGYKPDPKQVFAFKVVVPQSGTRYGSASATVQTGSMSAKLLVISETPGDTSTVGKERGCVAQGTESSRINMAFNAPGASSLVYCKLDAGKTYYINVSSNSKWGPGLTCTSASSCGFYFEGR